MKNAMMLAALVVGLGTRIAAAAPADVPAQPPVDERDPTTALLWSLGGTAASAGMLAVGIKANNENLIVGGLLSSLVTPSLGEIYAGKILTPGMGIRAASAVAVVYGVASSICWDNCNSSDQRTGEMLLAGGLIGYAAGTLYDIVAAPSAANEYNAAHRRLTIAPTMMNSSTGPVMGMGIGGKF